jgi:hypothetical protein
MTSAINKQHPAVVLRSHYRQLKALLAVAMVAVVGLSVAVAILAARGDATSSVDPLSLMTPQDVRYVQAISALTDRQLAAAFGTVRSTPQEATPYASPFEHGMPSLNPQAQGKAAR